MNTYIRLEAYGDGAADALVQAQGRMEELEGLWSVTDENSEIYAVNLGRNIVVIIPWTTILPL